MQFFAAVRAVFGNMAQVIETASAVGTFHKCKTPEDPQRDDQNPDPDKRMHIPKFAAQGADEKNNDTDNFDAGIYFDMGIQFQLLQRLFQ